MQIICISRGSYGYSKHLAEKLAAKLGYACVSRESITDEATDSGIPVGKLEMAVVKNRPLTEALAVEADLFKAFVTASLCERVLKGGVVYHGRTGHLVLPGLTNVLRVRAIADMDDRIELAMNRLNLSREKARVYNEQVDEDIRRWVRNLYNVDWDDPSLYALTINATHLSVENAAAALVQMAQLPEFQPTPASSLMMEDLLLAARCRLAVGGDGRTRDVMAVVRAENGNVSVTYPPRQARKAKAIPAVLEKIEGIRSLVCTVATTSILYIQERFDPETESFGHLLEISGKWNAAVEVVRLASGDGGGAALPGRPDGDRAGLPAAEASNDSPAGKEYDGGIIDDGAAADPYETAGEGVPEVMNRLIRAGRAGGFQTVTGGPAELVKSLSRTERYSLIVVGDVFLSKEGASKRLKRDLMAFLTDKFRVPVIGTEDLKARFLFGRKQLLGLVGSAALACLIYLIVFFFQEPIQEFISAGRTGGTLLLEAVAAIAVALFIPIVAFSVGAFYQNLLKLLKVE